MAKSDDGLRPICVEPYARSRPTEDANFDNFSENWGRYRNRIAVFLGAGASVGARNRESSPLPTAFHLRNILWQEFMTQAGVRFEPEKLGLVSLEHAAALIERRVGRDALIRHIVNCFSVQAPLWQHAVLPYLQPATIFTTNYDTLIEQGWRAHASIDGVGHCRQYYRDETPDEGAGISLYKPHGTIERAKEPVGEGGVVVTQFDYLAMLNFRRSALQTWLQRLTNACVLFIGYSFQDLDIAAELFAIRNPHEKRTIPWYAVFPRNDENVRAMYDERYGIRQINRTFVDFMADLDDRLNFLPKAWKYSEIKNIKGITT
jgi:hypothetical protein